MLDKINAVVAAYKAGLLTRKEAAHAVWYFLSIPRP